jgi:hypothetical protein
MRPTDPENATAKALDLLPADDPARSDPRLARDPECVAIQRSTQDAAAEVWLAASPLRAAPADLLPSILASAGVAREAPVRRRFRLSPWLAVGGWAAALAAICWPDGRGPAGTPQAAAVARAPAAPDATAREVPATPTASASRRERRLREELLNVQARLARAEEQARQSAPRVLSLSSPGTQRRTPEEARQRIWSVLTGALRSTLEVETGAPDDPAELVIERGWLPDWMVPETDSGLIRHRNFPEASWPQLGLLRSEDGSYYDPARGMIWEEEEDGRGFIGRKSTEADDTARFREANPEELAALSLRTQPEGFVVDAPDGKSAEVVIDQVPPTRAGYKMMVEWTEESGATNSMDVAETAASGLAAPAVGSMSVASASVFRGSSTMVLSLPNHGGVTAFQLVEVPLVADGKPKRVIVSGGDARSRRPRGR